ncbi:MAG: lipoyl(octanoyl) transferase LipB [Chthonomonadales bacterium]|nr:lipoyl(octanoyl) transferase LipB [Chthonomonadales bacterium]
MPISTAPFSALWLGRVPYAAAWQLQQELAAARAAADAPDLLLLLEHPPVITLGRAARPEHVLAAPGRLAALGVEVLRTDRGGDVTYHGPGQLVGYPVFDLARRGRDLHAYLRALEEALIIALDTWHLEASRFAPRTGVWIGARKVAAIGIKVSRWVTIHGFALNAQPDLAHFDLIVPCGIRDYGVTSIAAETGRSVEVADVVRPVASACRDVFGPLLPGPDRVSGLSPAPHAILAGAMDLARSLEQPWRQGPPRR